MNQFIQFKILRAVIIAVLALACLTISPMAQAVSPAPDGGYAGNNTAEGTQALQSLTTGIQNTALGFHALYYNTTGNYNSAEGFHALFTNTTGDNNTATGVNAMLHNTDGSGNTANGVNALNANQVGILNTAIGYEALFRNDSDSSRNTATGALALFSNTAGNENTANGFDALYSNSAGDQNTANGGVALYSNSAGDRNTAIGYAALQSNTTASNNSAVGYQALFHNNTGTHNTACGVSALLNNTTGGFNIALGDHAGANLTIGSNNIEIGHPGFAGEHDTIRIGNTAQARTFIAGVYAVNEGGPAVPVYVSSGGQLGTVASSARFKNEIKPMDKASEAILALKPVTFQYKSDPTGTAQFGLIAEEVVKANPDLVVRDEKGEIYTVRYDAVNAMLLNEFLKEHRKNEEQEKTITRLKSTVAQQQEDFQATAARQQKQIETLTAGLQKVSAQLASASQSDGGLEASKLAAEQIRRGGPASQMAVNNQ